MKIIGLLGIILAGCGNQTGINTVKGQIEITPGLTDVVAGRVDLMVLNLPIAYPQIKAGTVLPLALVVVILGGAGSLLGSFLGSFIIAFLYNYGQAHFPELAYFVLFLPMVIILMVRPQGLFGRVPS